MSNTLDLRPKQEPNIVVVEKVVLKKRTWRSEFFRMLSILVLVSVLGWGISKADSSLTANHALVKNFSAIGIVSSIDSSSLTLINANGSDNAFTNSYTFDTGAVTKIETSDYHALTLDNIQVGDRIIAQGIMSVPSTNTIEIHRLIDFNASSTIPEVYVPVASSTPTIIEASSTDATSTATDTTPTTPDVTSTTTEDDASTTDASSTDATSTILKTVTDVIQTVVDTVTGSSTDSN